MGIEPQSQIPIPLPATAVARRGLCFLPRVGLEPRPGVLAPFAHVLIRDQVGYMDGFVVARSVHQLGSNTGTQFHGYYPIVPMVCSGRCAGIESGMCTAAAAAVPAAAAGKRSSADVARVVTDVTNVAV